MKGEKASVKSSSEWPESPKTSSNPGVRFRTAALKNQHQRWSYAEQHHTGSRQCVPPQPQPTTTTLSYIHPNQYVLAGHGHNIYQHIHHHPYHHPLVSYGPICGNCCPAAPNPVFVGSQRSSITSLRGLTHDPSCNNHHILSKFEKPDEGAYGYSVSRNSSLSPPPKPIFDSDSVTRSSQVPNLPPKPCQCPMCYHSVKNPCHDCGCPDRSSSSSLKVNVKQSPASTNPNITPTFFSPSSDYYSLSPNSPPPEDLQVAQNGKGFPNSPESQRPISATLDNKSEAVEGQTEDEDKSKAPELNGNGHGGRADQDDSNDSRTHSKVPEKVSISVQQRSPIEHNKKQAPFERDLKNGRRHSWAGDKRVPVVQKQTSLSDFKKLLAKQSTSQNPHRTSAKELLQKSENGAVEPFYSSQKVGGSFRKRPSPRKDHRFSVIQEEIEGSKENLLNGKA